MLLLFSIVEVSYDTYEESYTLSEFGKIDSIWLASWSANTTARPNLYSAKTPGDFFFQQKKSINLKFENFEFINATATGHYSYYYSIKY